VVVISFVLGSRDEDSEVILRLRVSLIIQLALRLFDGPSRYEQQLVQVEGLSEQVDVSTVHDHHVESFIVGFPVAEHVATAVNSGERVDVKIYKQQ